MATGYSPKLPLTVDSIDGFCRLNKTPREVIKQNIKMLVLTAPGERIMNPNFGVGARNFLFNPSGVTFQNLKARIISQVKTYMPMVKIVKIETYDLNTDQFTTSDAQQMGLSIKYRVPELNLDERISITL
jgi:phage baseplate assembly protein W